MVLKKIPTLNFAKEARFRIDWIRAKAHFEPSTLVLRTRNSGKEGAFDGYCRL
jgi:hypothetical protein